MPDDQNKPGLKPYPLRDVVDETRHLIVHEPDYLPRINHFLFRGRCGFIKGQRVLAVGGTGDALVFLAEQLRDREAELHYVEPDTPRRTQTLGRLVARDLMGRVTIHSTDPQSLTEERIGNFDYISVSEGLVGVDDPSQTLIALSALLNRTGGMCVTVPGKYGRVGLELLRACAARLGEAIEQRGKRERLVSKLVSSLSGIHPFMAGRPPLEAVAHWERNLASLVHDTLDSQDRSWSVDDIFALLECQELHLIDFTFTDLADPVFTAYYRPHFFIHDSEIVESLHALPIRALYAIAEQLHGRMARHTFYASRMKESAASILRLDNVPFLWPQNGWRVQENKIIMRNAVGQEFAGEISVLGRTLFSAIDGRRTVEEICQEARSALPWRSLSDEDLGAELLQLYGNFGIWGGLMLRHESVPAFASYDSLYYGATE